jgi:hypothetical protein
MGGRYAAATSVERGSQSEAISASGTIVRPPYGPNNGLVDGGKDGQPDRPACSHRSTTGLRRDGLATVVKTLADGRHDDYKTVAVLLFADNRLVVHRCRTFQLTLRACINKCAPFSFTSVDATIAGPATSQSPANGSTHARPFQPRHH